MSEKFAFVAFEWRILAARTDHTFKLEFYFARAECAAKRRFVLGRVVPAECGYLWRVSGSFHTANRAMIGSDWIEITRNVRWIYCLRTSRKLWFRPSHPRRTTGPVFCTYRIRITLGPYF